MCGRTRKHQKEAIGCLHSPCRDLAVVHVGCNNHARFTFVALWGRMREVTMCWFNPLWLTRRRLIFTACYMRHVISAGVRQRQMMDKQLWIQIKKLPVVFFSLFFLSQRVLRTSWHIPKRFQPQVPNATPPDTNKETEPPHGAQTKTLAQLKILHWQKHAFTPLPGVRASWEKILCSWNVQPQKQF